MGFFVTHEGVVWGQTVLFGAGYSFCFLPTVLFRGAFCLKWAFIKDITGRSVAFKKGLPTMSRRLALEANVKKPDLKDFL